ncbi:pectin lyase fold/virulence factor, partial [Infundibulicybe gibba]
PTPSLPLAGLRLAAAAAAPDAVSCTLKPSPTGDDAPQLLNAVKACATVTIPKGLENKHIVQSAGTLKFTPNIPYWTGNAFFIPFQTQNIVLDGGGTLDGSGQLWWDTFASNSTLLRPIILTLFQATNVLVHNIKCDTVVIKNSPNATNVLVSNLDCTGSQSLGQFPGVFDIVENVVATNVKMTNAQNGARIKAGRAERREGISAVQNPVVIDQVVSSYDPRGHCRKLIWGR